MFKIFIQQENKLKSQWESTTYPLQWLKFKSLAIVSIGDDMKHVELAYTPDVNVKWYHCFENQFQNFF